MPHINKVRRNRGYSFEHTLIQRFNGIPGWCSRRLGGSSTGLPDVMATNHNGIVLSIEAKSTVGDLAYVPPDQVLRCITILDLFSYYKYKHVVFAFKFGQRKGKKLKEYFFSGDDLIFELPEKIMLIGYIRCRRNGECIINYKNDTIDLGAPMTFPMLINPNYKF